MSERATQQATHYTVIAGSADGEPKLEVVTAEELRRRLTANVRGDCYYGERAKLNVLTGAIGRLDLCGQLDGDDLIILRGEPVPEEDAWLPAPPAPPSDPDPWPNPSPGLPRLIELDAQTPRYTEG